MRGGQMLLGLQIEVLNDGSVSVAIDTGEGAEWRTFNGWVSARKYIGDELDKWWKEKSE